MKSIREHYRETVGIRPKGESRPKGERRFSHSHGEI